MTDEFQNLFEDNFLDDIKIQSTEKLKEGERRIVSVLFVDISGFTNLSESMDHEEVKDIVDKLFKVFTSSIEKHGGYVDKYVGDQIMALFGARVASEVDTHRAISCGLEMLKMLDKFNDYIINDKKINISENDRLSIRIGINTGMVTTGIVGKGREGDFTAYGGVVNLASRMESGAPKNTIMVPENLVKNVGDYFSFKDHGEIDVKGFSDKVRVYLVEFSKEVIHESANIPYIGNQENIKILHDLYETSLNAIEGGGRNKFQCIGIRAATGMGKSRLVTEFIKHTNQGVDTNHILRVEADNISKSPYKIFINLIKRSLFIDISDSSDTIKEKFIKGWDEITSHLENTEQDRLNAVKSRVAYLLGQNIGNKVPSLSGLELKNDIQSAIRIFIESFCIVRNLSNVPLVIIIDDLHFIDEASLDVLTKIVDAENIKAHRDHSSKFTFSFIFNYMDDYTLPESIKKVNSFNEILIKPLDRSECYEMVKYTMKEDLIPDEVVTVLLEHSEGNPFFIDEWLKGLGSEIKWSVDDIQSWISSIPESMHAVILSRIDTLDESCKQLLQCASVIGNKFYIDMLDMLKDYLVEPSRLHDFLVTLSKYNFIEPDRKKDGYYLFKHDLTQEVAYKSILTSNKKILHERLAEIIENSYEDRKEEFVEQLANHYEKSDNISKAKSYLIKAARESEQIFNLKSSYDFYSRAIKAYEMDNNLTKGNFEGLKKISTEDALELLIIVNEQIGIMLRLGEITESLDIANRIKHFLENNFENNLLLCKVYGTLGNVNFLMGKFDLSEEFLDKQIKLADSNRFEDEHLQALSLLSYIMIERGNYDSADKHLSYLKKTLENDMNNKNIRLLGSVLGDLGILNARKGNLKFALEYFQSQEKISTKNNQRIQLLKSLGNIGVIYKSLGKHEDALKIYDRILLLNQGIGDKGIINRTHGNKGVVLKNLKRYEEALKEFKLQIKISEYSEDKIGIGIGKSGLGNVYKEMKEFDTAVNCFNDALKIFTNMGDRREEGIALANIGETLLESGEADKSQNFLEKSLEVFREIGDKNLEKVVLDDLEKIKN